MANYPTSLDTNTQFPATGIVADVTTGEVTHTMNVHGAVQELEKKLGIGSSLASAATQGMYLVKLADGTVQWMGPVSQVQSWGWSGTLAVGSHGNLWRARRHCRITHVDAIIRTAPGTQAILVDLNTFDLTTGTETTILASQSDRISIAAGSRSSFVTLATPIDLPAATVIVPQIDQIGATGNEGANLTYTIRYEEVFP